VATPNAIRTFHLSEHAERGFAYAQATSADGLIHVAGTLALNEAFAPVGEGDMAAQLTCAYERIARTLAAHGVGFADVLKETLFVTSMDDMLAANGIRARVYGEHTPACTVVEVRRLAFPQCMVEIELVARARRP
jgi:2-iminobutanoate/2-iminopropanoate deaminase